MVKARWWIVGLFGVSWAFVRLIANDPSHPPAPVQTPSPSAKLAAQTVPPQALPKAEAPTSELGATETDRTRYVSGHRVALRSSPSKNGSIIDRLDFGRKVTFLGQENGWSHVRDDLTQRDGWVSSRLLSDERPKEKREPDKSEPKKVEPPKLPTLSDATIIARIIAESINGYPGNCPCPYNRDRAGHKCGSRSAYSRPGGYSPVCYPTDVTKAMIEAFRNTLQ